MDQFTLAGETLQVWWNTFPSGATLHEFASTAVEEFEKAIAGVGGKPVTPEDKNAIYFQALYGCQILIQYGLLYVVKPGISNRYCPQGPWYHHPDAEQSSITNP